MITRRVFFGMAGAAALAARGRAQTRAFSFDADGAGRTLRDPDGRVVLGYLTSKPAGVPLAGNSACCVHPFMTPNGERATDIAPPDHRDHRGIFFAWHDMTFAKGATTLKADFWGWGRYAPVEDRVIVNRDLRLVRSDADSAEIAVANDWMVATDVVLKEATSMRTAQEQGVRVLDLTYEFTSDYDVTLNRMAFTGFCFRCRKDGAYVLGDSNGEVTLPDSNAGDPTKNWPTRDWYSHTLTLPDGKVIASAVIDHPGNPTSTWHEPRSVSFLNPCVSALEPIMFPAGRALRLRYRAVAHDGPFPAGLLDAMAASWRKT